MPRRVKKPSARNKKFPGYPKYPESEDIYSREKEEADLDPEDPSVKKAPNPDPDHRNEKDFMEDVSGGDLDVPDVESETEKVSIDEDEENNHYSLGGDNHHNLEEGLWE